MAVFLTISYCWTFSIFPAIINDDAKNIFEHFITFILTGDFFRMHFQKWYYWIKVLSVFKVLGTY